MQWIIDNCNSNIEKAKDSIWWATEDIEYALDNLEECNY
jgi:hypothetical protein